MNDTCVAKTQWDLARDSELYMFKFETLKKFNCFIKSSAINLYAVYYLFDIHY